MTGREDHNDRDDQLLAGEYALGVLSEKERAQVEARVKTDAAFALLVEDWQARLGAFAAEAAPETPPARVWQAVQTDLFGSETGSGAWNSVALWRWLTAGAGAIAVASLAALLIATPVQQPPAGRLVAALQAEGAGPTFVASIEPHSGQLRINAVNTSAQEPRVPELWLIPDDGVPRSLGVISRAGESDVVIPEPLRPHTHSGVTLAITLEPEGGAPEGIPTGPVIAAGKITDL